MIIGVDPRSSVARSLCSGITRDRRKQALAATSVSYFCVPLPGANFMGLLSGKNVAQQIFMLRKIKLETSHALNII